MTKLARFTRLASLAVVLLGSARARADVAVGASPAYLELTLDPGKTTAQTILLFNNGKDPVTVSAYAWDWWHEPGNPRLFGRPGTLPHSAANWISFTPSEITVTPGKAVNVTVVVATPVDAKGGNYAVAWFEAIPDKKPDSKELRVGARLGVLIMTEVRGRAKPAVTIEKMDLTPPTESKAMRAALTIANTGDVHLFPKGTMVIMDDHRKLVGHVSFEKQRMLPGEKADVTMKYGGELTAGEYQAIITVDYGESGAVVRTANFTVGAGSPAKGH